MPTAARLVAAICWAALAYGASTLVPPLFPEGTYFGWMAEINAVIGLFCGWIVAGSRAGMGYNAAFGYGVTATAAMVFWGLFLHSSIEMVKRSLRKLYDGPVEAVSGIFELFLDFGRTIATPEIIGVLFVGGIVAGLITEFVGRRLP